MTAITTTLRDRQDLHVTQVRGSTLSTHVEGFGAAVIDLRQSLCGTLNSVNRHKARLVTFTHYWLLSEVVSGADD
jgi:hypothetical protein